MPRVTLRKDVRAALAEEECISAVQRPMPGSAVSDAITSSFGEVSDAGGPREGRAGQSDLAARQPRESGGQKPSVRQRTTNLCPLLATKTAAR